MLIHPVNIQNELIKFQKSAPELIDEVSLLLRNAEINDTTILNRLTISGTSIPVNIDLSQFDKNRIFTIETINAICVKYRLRFLDSIHFKSEFPYEAIYQINSFEKQHHFKIKDFKVMAPCGMFQLTDANEDPLLFAQLSENHFYLLHKWGKDLKWYRALVNYPLQSIYTFFISSVILAAAVAWIFPFDWLNTAKENELMFRFWLNTHFTIAFFFFFLFLGSLSNASFSDCAWNSKYFNQ